MADPYEGFAAFYDRWAADMTEDIPFYVELGREADGPWWSSRWALDGSRSRSRVRSAGE